VTNQCHRQPRRQRPPLRGDDQHRGSSVVQDSCLSSRIESPEYFEQAQLSWIGNPRSSSFTIFLTRFAFPEPDSVCINVIGIPLAGSQPSRGLESHLLHRSHLERFTCGHCHHWGGTVWPLAGGSSQPNGKIVSDFR
jgi:hypothetical protein